MPFTLQTPDGYNDWGENRTMEMVEFHLKAMEQQLSELYYAFALAHITQRTLILPKVTIEPGQLNGLASATVDRTGNVLHHEHLILYFTLHG